MTGLTEMEIAGRLLLGALLGGGIGLERQVHGRPAGFRTHLLVCVASVLLMIVSVSLGASGEGPGFDPGRLAAGAITGVGFLGAGVILKAGLSVHGLTTAACLWIVSAIGLAVGSGQRFAAVLGFAITLASLWLLRYVEAHVPRLAYKHIRVVADRGAPEERVRAAVAGDGQKIVAVDYAYDAAAGRMTYRMTVTSEHRISERAIVEALASLPQVREVEVASEP